MPSAISVAWAIVLWRSMGPYLDPAKLKRLAKQFERILIPRQKRGRKNDPRIDAAYRDSRLGLPIRKIAEIHVPGYKTMNSSHKRHEIKRLQAAFRGRERSRRRELQGLTLAG